MVNTYVLEGQKLLRREQAHPYLALELALPAHYGMNLDALYDCLTERGPCAIVLYDAALLRQEGSYGARILATLEQAARDNPHLHLELL